MKAGSIQSAFLILFAVMCLTATATMTILVLTRGVPPVPGRGPAASPPPLLRPVGPFELTDSAGKPFAASDLAGRIYVLDFMFTRCQLVCPLMSARMRWLQQRLADHPRRDEVHLVSVSVDPEHDTPAVLDEYASRVGAETARWSFLTGSRDAIWSLSEKQFLLPTGAQPDNELMPIGHSSRFALVDREGRILNYYDSGNEGDMQRLLADIERALEE